MSESKIEVMNHYGDFHNTPTNIKYCSNCKQAFYKMGDLRKHLRVLHNKEVPMESCLMCEETFLTSKRAVHHMEAIHRNLKFRCTRTKNTSKSLCHEYFDNMQDLKTHLKSHKKPEEGMNCHICGKDFSVYAVFQRHIQSHSMEKSFSCPHCEKQFCFEIDLRKHIKKSHTLRVKCDLCDYKGGQNYELVKHMTTKHSEERNHKCNICGKAFKLNSYLERHL